MQLALVRRRIDTRFADAGLAAAVAGVGLVEVWANAGIHPKAVAYPCEVGLGIVLAWRRRYPLATLVAVAALATVEAVAGVPLEQPWVPLAAYMVAVYSLVTLAPRDRALAGLAIAAIAVAVEVIDQHKGLGNFAFAMVFIVPIWLAGRTIRARTARAEELEREQEERALAAVEEERRRIARELHDVISHSLGVVVLQAGAVEQVLERDPERAREMLRSIRRTGQEAIGELGTLLTLARGEVESSREPQPALADLERLVANTREAGLPVELDIEGPRRPLPAAVELSAYRVVQEGLTNVLKHAGGASARVVLRYRQDELEVEVSDDGVRSGDGRGSRRGLAGIAERVAVFGGRFEAGPAREGGWRLRATLPVPL
jgi:signal transduction histidine kinase